MGWYVTVSGWVHSRWLQGLVPAFFNLLFAGHIFLLPWYAGYRAPRAHLAELKHYCDDKQTPVVCYPRNCDSAAFYIGRDDLQSYRSKQTHLLVRYLQDQPRTVLLLTHRHSLQSLRYALTPDLHIVGSQHFGLDPLPGLSPDLGQKLSWFLGETALGLCDVAVVERRNPQLSGPAQPAVEQPALGNE
jgi:hypothetical protein